MREAQTYHGSGNEAFLAVYFRDMIRKTVGIGIAITNNCAIEFIRPPVLQSYQLQKLRTRLSTV